LTWAGLLPLARLVESIPAGWVPIQPDEVDGEPRQMHHVGTTKITMDRSLLSCLVDRWRPETHTFHFPWGEMAPTLQDVSYLLGLPLAGAVLGPADPPPDWHEAMQARFAGVHPRNPMLPEHKHGVPLKWLNKWQVNVNYVASLLSRCILHD
jgi:hypothetical protein